MNITPKERHALHVLLSKMPCDDIKTDKQGNITNWNELSESTKEWIKGHA